MSKNWLYLLSIFGIILFLTGIALIIVYYLDPKRKKCDKDIDCDQGVQCNSDKKCNKKTYNSIYIIFGCLSFILGTIIGFIGLFKLRFKMKHPGAVIDNSYHPYNIY